MIMKRIISYNLCRILAVTLLSALIFSCNEVLDKTPIDSYSDAAVWKDEALTEAFANTTYKYLPHGFVLPSGLRFLPYANISDECNSRNSWSTVGIVIMGNQSSAYGGPLDVWTKTGSYNGSWNYWKPISQVNKFLDKMDESTIDEELKNRLIAEMRTIRAYSYFKLISHFGGVPLITKSFSLEDDFRIPRNTYEEVLDFIITELDESIGSLPLEYSAENDGRITKGAAMAIKSRTLLYAASPLNNPNNDQAKWQAAADALEDV